MEKFTFFWNGPFSQWKMSEFTEGDITFNCAEQYMMYKKAILFDDMKIAKRILNSNDPRDQKALGRKVIGFSTDVWNRVAKDIVKRGSELKYSQNEELRKLLLATKGTTLVEASPYDTIWGIGLREDNHSALNRESWPGKNWLGEILTEVRDNL